MSVRLLRGSLCSTIELHARKRGGTRTPNPTASEVTDVFTTRLRLRSGMRFESQFCFTRRREETRRALVLGAAGAGRRSMALRADNCPSRPSRLRVKPIAHFHRAAGELSIPEARACARKRPTLFQTEPQGDESPRRDLNPRPPAPDETEIFTTGGVMDARHGVIQRTTGNRRTRMRRRFRTQDTLEERRSDRTHENSIQSLRNAGLQKSPR